MQDTYKIRKKIKSAVNTWIAFLPVQGVHNWDDIDLGCGIKITLSHPINGVSVQHELFIHILHSS